MGMNWQSEVLIEGAAQGSVLRLDEPISFWGGIDPTTSQVILAGHPQYGQQIADTILVIPSMIGSSSSSAIMLELIYKGIAPRALVLGGRDAILPIGVVVAGQMRWKTMPVVTLPEPPFHNGDRLKILKDGMITIKS